MHRSGFSREWPWCIFGELQAVMCRTMHHVLYLSFFNTRPLLPPFFRLHRGHATAAWTANCRAWGSTRLSLITRASLWMKKCTFVPRKGVDTCNATHHTYCYVAILLWTHRRTLAMIDHLLPGLIALARPTLHLPRTVQMFFYSFFFSVFFLVSTQQYTYALAFRIESNPTQIRVKGRPRITLSW